MYTFFQKTFIVIALIFRFGFNLLIDWWLDNNYTSITFFFKMPHGDWKYRENIKKKL